MPIVTARDRLTGCEFDVCVASKWGGSTGEATTRAAAFAAERHAGAFRPVLLFLKAALSEAALNKPFSGGLGSFKLCALLSNYLDAVSEADAAAAGARPPLLPPGPVLLGFSATWAPSIGPPRWN